MSNSPLISINYSTILYNISFLKIKIVVINLEISYHLEDKINRDFQIRTVSKILNTFRIKAQSHLLQNTWQGLQRRWWINGKLWISLDVSELKLLMFVAQSPNNTTVCLNIYGWLCRKWHLVGAWWLYHDH